MKFALLLGFSDYRDFPALAQAAEQAGFNSMCMPDSLFYPKSTDSEYPYNDTQTIRNYIGASAFIEPFISMATMAAVTSRIRFYPSVLKVPVRQPLVLAKLLTSLAVVREREIGTLEQLMVTPLSAGELIMGKTLPFALISLRDLALVCAVTVSTILLLFTWLTLRNRGAEPDPLEQSWQYLCRRLARLSRPRKPGEAPREYAAVVIAAQPELAAALNSLTTLYLRLRYESVANHTEILRFRRLVRQLRLPPANARG